jgi:uncharacterized protein YxeA
MFLRKLFGIKPQEVYDLIHELSEAVHALDPLELSDPLLADVYARPVITNTTGHIYERSGIEEWLKSHATCPRSNQPLSKNNLVDAGILTNTIDTFHRDKNALLKRIKSIQSLSEKSGIEALIQTYTLQVNTYSEELEEKRKVLAMQFILEAKERLKLDIKSAKHLAFWNEKKGCCGMGLVKVTLNSRHFYLSPRTHQVLVAANQSYFCLADFYTAIKKVQMQPTTMWNRLFQTDTSVLSNQIKKLNLENSGLEQKNNLTMRRG